HDAAGEVAVLDGGGDRPSTSDLVDHAQVVGVAVLDRTTFLEKNAERRPEHVRLDVVGGEAVAGEQGVDPAVADEPGQVGAGAGVDHRRSTHGEDLPALGFAGLDAVGDL